MGMRMTIVITTLCRLFAARFLLERQAVRNNDEDQQRLPRSRGRAPSRARLRSPRSSSACAPACAPKPQDQHLIRLGARCVDRSMNGFSQGHKLFCVQIPYRAIVKPPKENWLGLVIYP